MDKTIFENKKLYTILSGITRVPYMIDGRYFLLTSDYSSASQIARRIEIKLSGLYTISPVVIAEITDLNEFMHVLNLIGDFKFLFEDTGMVDSVADYCGVPYVINDGYESFYEEYTKYLCLKKASRIGSVKAQKISAMETKLRPGSYSAFKETTDKNIDMLKKYYKVRKTDNYEEIKMNIASKIGYNRPKLSIIMFAMAVIFSIIMMTAVEPFYIIGRAVVAFAAAVSLIMGFVLMDRFLKAPQLIIAMNIFLLGMAAGENSNLYSIGNLIYCLIVVSVCLGVFFWLNRSGDKDFCNYEEVFDFDETDIDEELIDYEVADIDEEKETGVRRPTPSAVEFKKQEIIESNKIKVSEKIDNQHISEKANRPIEATVMFLLGAFFLLALIGFIINHDISYAIGMGIIAAIYFVSGIFMCLRYVKGWGWIISGTFSIWMLSGGKYEKDFIIIYTVFLILMIISIIGFIFSNIKSKSS